VLAQLPIWLVAIAGFPWWGRRMLVLLRDLDRYRDERDATLGADLRNSQCLRDEMRTFAG
jgi:hypothetical protein